jgi:hypothetical protein
MDFINPAKRRQNKLQLIIGYFLVAVAVALTTLVLLFAAYGYGLGKNGQIIQNGLVFVASNPSPAQIYLNGALASSTTNTRLQLPAGQYTLKLTRAGYRPWVRSLGVEGGSVEHFDYPFLFPTNLVTTNVQTYNSQPGLVLQSPDRHWLLVEQPGSLTNFTQYDLTGPKALAASAVPISLPAGLLTSSKDAGSWQLVNWSTDNQHVLLEHVYSGGSEYILLDRQTPADSVNLTKTLNLPAGTELSSDNDKYDQYYEFNPNAGTLDTATLSAVQPVSLLSHVLTFNSYGSNVVLYATDQGVPSGQVNVDVLQGTTNSVIRQEPTGTDYLLDITQYSGDWYVVAGATSDNKVYVYENPMAAVQSRPDAPLVPVYIINKVNAPNYVAFSANAQFVVVEGGNNFGVYDAENAKSYAYINSLPVAAGQHATWMDGDRLTLVSSGKVVVFDYDDANQQTLQPAVDGATSYFDQNYKWTYTIAPSSTAGSPFALTQTGLLIPADQ